MAATTAEGILQKIFVQAEDHEYARQMDHDDLIALRATDAVAAAKYEDFAKRQQGIENIFAKVQQHLQEKTHKGILDQEMIKGGKKPDQGTQVATVESQKEAAKDIKESASKDFENGYAYERKKWAEGFKESLRDKSSWTQFRGGFKTDMNLLQGKMALLTNLPIITTLLAVSKFLLARLALFFLSGKLGQALFGKDSWMAKFLGVDLTEALTDLVKTLDPAGKKSLTQKRAEESGAGEDKPKIERAGGSYTSEERKAADAAAANKEKEAEETDESTGKSWKASFLNNKAINAMSLTKIKDAIATFRSSAFFTVASSMFVTAMAAMTTALSAAAVAMGMATSPLWATAAAVIGIVVLVIALVVLFGLAIAWLIGQRKVIWQAIKDTWKRFTTWISETWDKIVEITQGVWATFTTWITDKWDSMVESIKEGFETFVSYIKFGVQKIKDIGTMIKTWFSDTASDVGLKIKHMIAVITDGIAGVVNNIIESIKAKFPRIAAALDIDKYKLEGGAVEDVAKQRADFEAMKLNRDFGAAQTGVDTAAGEKMGWAYGGTNLYSPTMYDQKITKKDSYFTETGGPKDKLARELGGPPM